VYDPTIGRFLQQDPLGLALDENPYRFADNSPTQYMQVAATGAADDAAIEKIEKADAESDKAIENGNAAVYDEKEKPDPHNSEVATAEQLQKQAIKAVGGNVKLTSGIGQTIPGANPFLTPAEQFLESITQGKTKPLGRVFIMDHGRIPPKQQHAEQEFGDRLMDETDMRNIAEYVAENGVIVFSGCFVGQNEAYLVRMAAAAKRRVRAFQGLTSGATVAENENLPEKRTTGKLAITLYYVEADQHGNIRYYFGAYSTQPHYVKMKGGTFIEYVTVYGNRTGVVIKYKWRQLTDGTIIIYDPKTHKVVMTQDRNGLIHTKGQEDGDKKRIDQDEGTLTSLQVSEGY
jgi:hypothetical protein